MTPTYPITYLQQVARGVKVPRAALTELTRDSYIHLDADGTPQLTPKGRKAVYRKDTP